MTFVDSNVFVIDLRYPRDPNAPANRQFLDALRARGSGVTGAINVLEVCGVLSFNLSDLDLRDLYHHFERRYGVTVLPRKRELLPLVPSTGPEVLATLCRRFALGDALVAVTLERWAPRAEAFVSWNARHFSGKLTVPALTPVEWLALGAAAPG